MLIMNLIKFNISKLKRNKILYFIFIFESLFLGFNVFNESIAQFQKYNRCITPNIMLYYPAFYIKDWLSIICIMFIFLVCIFFVSEVESKRIILPIFSSYSRKQILLANWLSVNLLIIFVLVMIGIVALIIGSPFLFFYYKFYDIYKTLVSIPPLNFNIIMLTFGILLSQYISLNLLIQVTFLFGIIYKNQVKAGIASLVFLFASNYIAYKFPEIEKFFYLFYGKKFISLQVSLQSGDILYISSMSGIYEYIIGLIVCLLPSVLIYIIMANKFQKYEI